MTIPFLLAICGALFCAAYAAARRSLPMAAGVVVQLVVTGFVTADVAGPGIYLASVVMALSGAVLSLMLSLVAVRFEHRLRMLYALTCTAINVLLLTVLFEHDSGIYPNGFIKISWGRAEIVAGVVVILATVASNVYATLRGRWVIPAAMAEVSPYGPEYVDGKGNEADPNPDKSKNKRESRKGGTHKTPEKKDKQKPSGKHRKK